MTSPVSASYSFVDDLAASVPELKALIAKATSGKWTAQRFADAVQTTQWWRTNSDTAKQMIDLEKVDPAQYQQQYKQAQAHVEQMAASLGITMTAAQIATQATTDLWQGQDDATLQQQIGQLYTTVPGGSAGGTAVQLNAQIKALAANYGVPVTQSWIDSQVKASLTTGNGTEGATAALTQIASSTYPGLAAQLQAGMTVHDIAQPYMAAMSQILEIPETSITLQDQTIQKALQAVPPTSGSSSGTPKATGGSAKSTGGTTGPITVAPPPVRGGSDMSSRLGAPGASTPATPAQAPGVVPLWQFQQQLRQDPRWQNTDNAKQSAFSMLHTLGNSWGFSS